MRAPYGSWSSPVSAERVAVAAPRIDGAQFTTDATGAEEVWWGQSVPAEAGRTAVLRRGADGQVAVVLPAPWSARSRVHEYGGGAWAALGTGALAFVEKNDQRIWMLRPGADPIPLTPPSTTARFGGLRHAAGILVAVREDHATGTPRREIVAVPLDGTGATDPAALRCLAGGTDFLAQPALSPDGRQLAWIGWNHPDMPWDHTILRVAGIDGVHPTEPIIIADAPLRAPLQPEWQDDGRLLYLDEPGGRWNLHIWSASTGARIAAPADADTGGPLWSLGGRWYMPLAGGGAVCVRTEGGDTIVRVDADGQTRSLGGPVVAGASVEDARERRALVAGATAEGGAGLWIVDADTDRWEEVTGGAAPWPAEWTPAALTHTFNGPHGPVHAVSYPPTHPEMSAPDGELAPYVVLVHGGPTAHSGGAPTPKIVYFTSRGIGVLEVNYGGSTGYGRAYRDRLRGQWGVVDVDDVAAAARGLCAAGEADPHRLAIDGGSAGGWTVLAAIARTDVFAAGISRYGVGDARALAADTHDFEARYLDGLIGPLPQAENIYIERSPLSHADGFDVPMLLLQGEDDEVVPPAQAEAIRAALSARSVPHAYVLYPGEGHGFRRAETIVDALEKELAFLGAVFGFDTPGVAALPLES